VIPPRTGKRVRSSLRCGRKHFGRKGKRDLEINLPGGADRPPEKGRVSKAGARRTEHQDPTRRKGMLDYQACWEGIGGEALEAKVLCGEQGHGAKAEVKKPEVDTCSVRATREPRPANRKVAKSVAQFGNFGKGGIPRKYKGECETE